jgi:hypothetical protein
MSFLPPRSDRESIVSTLTRLKISIPETPERPEGDLDTIFFALEKLQETVPSTSEGREGEIPSKEEAQFKRLAEKAYHATEALFKAGTIQATTLQLVRDGVANRYVPRVDLTAFARKPDDDMKTEK